MFIIFGIMISGIVIGCFLRRIPNLTIIGKLISIFIFSLLFFLGISVGSNKVILGNLTTIGVESLIITLAAVLGSVLMALLIYTKFYQK